MRYGTEDGEPELHGTVTAVEDDPEDGPVLTVTLPRRPRQRKDRTEGWALNDVLDEAHLRLPGDVRRDDHEAMLRALRRCRPRPAPGAPPGDDDTPVGGPGLVPPWLAFHEAGHAVAQLALDERMPTAPAPVWRVVARRRGKWEEPYTDGLGREIMDIQGLVEGRDRCRPIEWDDAVRCGGPRLAWAREALWLEVLQGLAGPVAEAGWR